MLHTHIPLIALGITRDWEEAESWQYYVQCSNNTSEILQIMYFPAKYKPHNTDSTDQ